MVKPKDPEKKCCFVIGPVGDPDTDIRVHADWLLEEILQPVFESYPSFILERADRLPQPGMIDSQIIRKLRDAELVIADLSMPNANVFYEIGIRHMFRKTIIHMQLRDDKIPFDVSLYRAIKFSRRRPSDLRLARQELTEMLEAVLSADYEIDNPITRAIGQINFQEKASPEQQVLLDKINAIERRLAVTEARPAKNGLSRSLTHTPPIASAMLSTAIGLRSSMEIFYDRSVVSGDELGEKVLAAASKISRDIPWTVSETDDGILTLSSHEKLGPLSIASGSVFGNPDWSKIRSVIEHIPGVLVVTLYN